MIGSRILIARAITARSLDFEENGVSLSPHIQVVLAILPDFPEISESARSLVVRVWRLPDAHGEVR
jgi:hypothetical protein